MEVTEPTRIDSLNICIYISVCTVYVYIIYIYIPFYFYSYWPLRHITPLTTVYALSDGGTEFSIFVSTWKDMWTDVLWTDCKGLPEWSAYWKMTRLLGISHRNVLNTWRCTRFETLQGRWLWRIQSCGTWQHAVWWNVVDVSGESKVLFFYPEDGGSMILGDSL